MARAGKTGPVGADVVAELRANGALDDLFARIDSGEIELTGDGGNDPRLLIFGVGACMETIKHALGHLGQKYPSA